MPRAAARRRSSLVLLFMFVFGFAKAAIMPFHAWLPAAMVAPTPVSALLHAVAVVKVGVFSIVRVLTGVFGTELAGLHRTWDCRSASSPPSPSSSASLIALSQDELKRRLAFSHHRPALLHRAGRGPALAQGLTGGMLHIAMHAFGKITLFFCAGAIFVATGKKYISEMVGIGRRMPVTMAAFFVGLPERDRSAARAAALSASGIWCWGPWRRTRCRCWWCCWPVPC